MTISISVTSIEMSGTNTISVPRSGVVVFVGPNNFGKSLSLRNIRDHLYIGVSPPQAVKDIKVEKSGTEDELTRWLGAIFPIHYHQGQKGYLVSGNNVMETQAISRWHVGPPYADLMLAFVFFAAGEGRLQAANPSESFDPRQGGAGHPLQIIYQDTDLERKLSDICSRAFGKPLFLDRFAGNKLYLGLGEPPPPPENVMRPPKEYLDIISSFPTVDQQGDGMKSFVGLMLHLTTRPYQIILVDEPEAFLHPPQARLMGRLLVEEKPAEAQVFVATHDSDVLTGVLDVPEANVTVVRLNWDGEVNHASQLDPEKVRDLWQNPLLRYSNILDGLFHEAVVLCEGDADCRFYASVLDVIEAGKEEAKRPDLLFTHCGGKHRMPTVIDALAAVSVPVRVITDFDVLRDEHLLKSIVKSLGGNWSSLKIDRKVVKSTLDQDTRAPSKERVLEKLEKVLNDVETPTLQKTDETKIRMLIKTDSGWDRAKKSGKSAVPAGQPTARLESLLAALRQLGLFVVEVGELERFVPTVGGPIRHLSCCRASLFCRERAQRLCHTLKG